MRRAALNLLARREHSYRELRRKLISKKYASAQQVEQLLNELAAENLLSDARFAEAYVHAKSLRGFGPIRIREELKERGVATTIIEQYLDEHAEFWLEYLAQTWQKRFGKQPPQDFLEYAKQARFLQYRGFDSNQIKTFFNKIAAIHAENG